MMMQVTVVLLFGLALIVVVGAMMAVPVMLLWNGVLPNLFPAGVIKQIDFWNAWGLLILCGLLFKAYTPSSKSD